MASSITCTCMCSSNTCVYLECHTFYIVFKISLFCTILIIINSFNVSCCRWLNILLLFSIMLKLSQSPPTHPPKKKKKSHFPLVHPWSTDGARWSNDTERLQKHAQFMQCLPGVTSLLEVSFIWFNIKHKNGVQIEHLRWSRFFKPGAGMGGAIKNSFTRPWDVRNLFLVSNLYFAETSLDPHMERSFKY